MQSLAVNVHLSSRQPDSIFGLGHVWFANYLAVLIIGQSLNKT
jgi:hypothetical protein